MKLSQLDFIMEWPVSIDVKYLRKYLTDKLIKNGELIRWSIIEIQDSAKIDDMKKIRIIAVLAN